MRNRNCLGAWAVFVDDGCLREYSASGANLPSIFLWGMGCLNAFQSTGGTLSSICEICSNRAIHMGATFMSRKSAES